MIKEKKKITLDTTNVSLLFFEKHLLYCIPAMVASCTCLVILHW